MRRRLRRRLSQQCGPSHPPMVIQPYHPPAVLPARKMIVLFSPSGPGETPPPGSATTTRERNQQPGETPDTAVPAASAKVRAVNLLCTLPPQRPAPAAPREINYLVRSADFSRRDVSSFPLRCRVFPRCPLFWPRRATLPTLNLRPTNLFCIRAYNGVLLTSDTNGLPMVYNGLQWFTMVYKRFTKGICIYTQRSIKHAIPSNIIFIRSNIM